MTDIFDTTPADPAQFECHRQIASHVAWYYDHTAGYRPGSFTEKLLSAIGNADRTNRVRLALGFPEYVAAMTLCMDVPGGTDRIKEIARG